MRISTSTGRLQLHSGIFAALAAAAVMLAWVPPVLAQPHMSSYQGQLVVAGVPYSGTADFKFVIVDPTPNPPVALWSNDGTSTNGEEPSTSVPVAVSNGGFSVYLGQTPMVPILPEMLAGATHSVILRVWVDTGSGFTQLTDQFVASAPYALHSRSAEVSHGTFVADGQIESTVDGFKFPDGTVQVTAATAEGSFWSLLGNAGTNPNINYVGTSDETELRLCVAGRRSLRIEPTGLDGNGDPRAPNFIAGRGNNSVTDGVFGATIAGGGAIDDGNSVTDLYGTVSGGVNNRAGDNDAIVDNAPYATVGGGRANRANQWYATISGGWENQAMAQNTFVGGGRGNTATASSATIAGGYQNAADGNSAAIGGGTSNVASGSYGTVSGGVENTANGYCGAVPGGSGNRVLADASYSFAAGRNARAEEEGAFVWSDNSSDDPFTSKGANTISIRSAGGVKIADAAGVVQIKLNPTTGVTSTPALEITGGLDLAEPFDMSDPNLLPAGTVVVIDEHRPSQLRMSRTAYDTRVAGVISGAGGISPGVTFKQTGIQETGQYVALTGRVFVLADATEEPIRPGDLLTTSSTPGHAMRASDPDRRMGAILGKAMSSLESGRGLVLILVSLQ